MNAPITLATLHLASDQEVFDQVAKHLLTQMKKSELPSSGLCAYRSPEGLKCAAGCLMAEHEVPLGSHMTRTWEGLMRYELVPAEHKDLILALQEIHDDNEPVNWREELEIFARNHFLLFRPEMYK